MQNFFAGQIKQIGTNLGSSSSSRQELSAGTHFFGDRHGAKEIKMDVLLRSHSTGREEPREIRMSTGKPGETSKNFDFGQNPA
ncbi:hypothetical protein [Rhizobium leguminosarum]|uniref:hypothetical protein n=1 Tax=Rhizobium leguminosarum TaxID=384 RepID=UPI0011AE2A85|nr:hypothetical protein [Rhizobium leguminosarum]